MSPCHWDETGRYVRSYTPGAPQLGTCYRPGHPGPAGGIIVYHKHDGFTVQGYGNPGDLGYFASYTAYYLEAMPDSTFTNIAWSTTRTKIDGITTFFSADDPLASLIGNGRRDTQLLVNHFTRTGQRGTAAQRCADYSKTNSGTVYRDWFLPSAGEMNEIYTMQGQVAWLSPQRGAAWFWSSSQTDTNYAWQQHTHGDWRYPRNLFGGFKANAVGNVRPVRAF
jgi:hypothetical protein